MTVNLDRSQSTEELQSSLADTTLSRHELCKKLFINLMHSCMKRVDYISNFLGNDHIDPPFKRDENKIKRKFSIEDYSDSKLKIGSLRAKDYLFYDHYKNITECNSLIREENINHKLINKQNSLFLNRENLEKKDRIEIIRNAKNIDQLCSIDPKRFKLKPGSKCVLDTKFNIVYKLKKYPKVEKDIHLKDFAHLTLRGSLNLFGIKNIIFPTRETWRKKDGNKISEVIIEDHVDGLENHIDVHGGYDLNPRLFDNAVLDFTCMACAVDILGLTLSEEDFNLIHNPKKPTNIYKLHQSSQINGSKFNNRISTPVKITVKLIDEEEAVGPVEVKEEPISKELEDLIKGPEMSWCDFRKLPLKFCEKDKVYKFVFINTDVCQIPQDGDDSTLYTLFHMFPKHKELIFKKILEISPNMLLGANSSPCRKPIPMSSDYSPLTEESIIERYKEVKSEVHASKQRDFGLLVRGDEFVKKIVDTIKKPNPPAPRASSLKDRFKKYFKFK